MAWEAFFEAKTRLELGGGGGEGGARTGGGSAEAPQRLGSGARPGSLEGRLSGTGWINREWLERRRGAFVRFLRPEPVCRRQMRGSGCSSFAARLHFMRAKGFVRWL